MTRHDADIPAPQHQARGRLTPVVLGMMAICIVIELALVAADHGLVGAPTWRSLAYQNGAFWPGLLHGWQPNFAIQPVTMFFTYAFLHGGPGHLLGNMITLLALGEIAVDRVGSQRFLAIYVLSALGGAALFGLTSTSPQPMVGASGALFGLAGAWQYWEYRDAGNSFRHIARTVVWLCVLNIVLWFLLDGLLAWQTHLGGFLAGWATAAGLARLPPSGRTS